MLVKRAPGSWQYTILAPDHVVKFIQPIWRLNTCSVDEIYGWPFFNQNRANTGPVLAHRSMFIEKLFIVNELWLLMTVLSRKRRAKLGWYRPGSVTLWKANQASTSLVLSHHGMFTWLAVLCGWTVHVNDIVWTEKEGETCNYSEP